MNRNTLFEQPKINAPFVGILILFTTICALNIPILITLWRHGFDDGTYSHAFLIPFISLYLYYELAQSGKLQFREKFAVLPTILILLSCYLLFVTTNAQISIGYWLAFLAVLITSVTMVYRFNWYVVFPAAFLIFIFPFWGVLVPLLQNISVAAVTYMMSFTGVPTYVEAEMITIPAGVFEIADGCSGLRYMIVSLAIGSLFIFLNIRDTKRAALFLSLTILGALLTNWIRITALILIGEYTNMESSLMADHNTFGWYLYVPFMILLFVWGNKLSDININNSKAEPSKTIIKKIDNKKIILLLVMSLLLSSTFIRSYSENTAAKITDKTVIYPYFPLVHNYSDVVSVKTDILNSKSIYNIYYFNGNDLDGKPTFFGNKLIPNGWMILEQKTNQHDQLFIITDNINKAILSTSFEINGAFYSTKHAFKVARIKSALKGIKKSKLHWKLEYCTNSCRIN
jgi:exosortase A